MKKVVILAVLCFVTYCSAQGVAYTLTADDRALFLNSHNAVRKAYGLDPLVWDDQLEKDSAAYALKCLVNPLTHSTQPTDRTLQYGENLSTYMARPKPAVFPYKDMAYHVVNGWYSEEVYWNCKTSPAGACTNKDSAGRTGQCGHLTQIIWKSTTTVGCGIASCPGVMISSKDWYVQNAVCRYRTAGNVIGWHPLDPGGSTGISKCPVTPTTLGPFVPVPVGPTKPPLSPVTPVTPTAPVKPPTSPVTPTTPVKPAGPTTPVTPVKPAGPTTPVKPPTSPVTPPTAPVTPPTAPTSGVWWKDCIADYWPTDSTGKQTQKLTPCAWEPWVDKASGKTWCCPNPADEWDYSWPTYNIGKPECPSGKAPSYARAEENADTDNGLPMGAWIGIAVAIAVVIIIVIVVIIIVQKKKNDERV